MIECPPGELEAVCTQQDRWPTIGAWNDEVIEPDWNDPALQAEALAAAEVTIRWLEPPGFAAAAAVNQERVRAGRDFERYVQKSLERKWGIRFQRTYTYTPPPLDIEMTYFASAQVGEFITAVPIRRPANAPARVVRGGNRLRYADGFISASRRTHERGTMIEAKCLDPWLRFNGRRPWSWAMQIGFMSQLYDYLAYARRSWGRGAFGVPPIRVNYYFCDFIPHWAGLLIAAAMASDMPSGIFDLPDRLPTPPGANWIRSPTWYPDALGLADGVGFAIEHWEGFLPWGEEGGDWLMNITGSVYDQFGGSE